MNISALPAIDPALMTGAASRPFDATTAAGRPTAEEAAKAAGQFEAILVRQLLAPAIEPLMSGMGGGQGMPGGGVYSYLLSDTLANAITAGGGLGFHQLIQSQLGAETNPSADQPE